MLDIKKIVVMIGVLLLAACATTKKVDLMAEGLVEVAAMPSNEVIFRKVDVHQHNGETEIEVVVAPKQRQRHFDAGQVNVLIVKPDGSEQKIQMVNSGRDHHSPGHKLQHSHFMVYLPYLLPAGTQIGIEHRP